MEFLKDILGEELYAQVAEKLEGNDKVRIVNAADGSWIPKGKLDDERQTVKDLKAQLADINTKLTAAQSGAQDADAVRAQLTQLQADMAAKDAAMQKQALEYRIRDAVRGSKARNADIVLKMIDAGKISQDGDNLIGLNDQIEALKKSDAYLFEAEPVNAGGVDPHQNPGTPNTSGNFEANAAIRGLAGF